MAIDILEKEISEILVEDNPDKDKPMRVTGVWITDRKTTVDQAIATIKESAARGDYFSSAQMDVFIDAMLFVMPEAERPLFNEICEVNGVPKWQVLWSYYRRALEWGVGFALLLDPNWEAMGVKKIQNTTCEECGGPIVKPADGQRWCSNRCGGQAELKAKRAQREVTINDQQANHSILSLSEEN